MVDDFDPGPFNWVKQEIDLALSRADEELEAYKETQDRTHFKFCRTHLHQAHGALNIVDLPGLTLLTEAQEKLLVGLEDQCFEVTPKRMAVLKESIAALRAYLKDVAGGRLQQPTVLFSQLNALYLVQDKTRPSPAVLFFPKLDWRPPKRTGVTKLSAEARAARLKEERKNFQQGLIVWLRLPPDNEKAASGLSKMSVALAEVGKIVESSTQRVCWRIAGGLMAALAQPEISVDPDARHLCSLIDAQLRRTQEGSERVAERLLRESLYFIARAKSGKHPLIDEIVRDFKLHREAGPPDDKTNVTQETRLAPDEALHNRLKQCQTYLDSLEQSLDIYFRDASQQIQLADSTQHVQPVAQFMRELERPQAVAEIEAIGESLAALHSPATRPEDAVFSRLAQRLTLFRFYINSLSGEPPDALTDFDAFSKTQDTRKSIDSATRLEDSLEAELATRQGEIRRIMEAIAADPRTATQLKAALQSLRQDADLTADRQLNEQLISALQHLETTKAPAVAEVIAGQATPAVAPAAIPSETPAETVALTTTPEPMPTAEATDEDIKVELLQIFLEEASEVLYNMATPLAALQKKPDDLTQLTDIRRGFHTLKGSGRMVGLRDLANFAWEIEQTLNLRLRNEATSDDALNRLIAAARDLLAQWMQKLKSAPSVESPQTDALVAEARLLRTDDPLQVLEGAAISPLKPETKEHPTEPSKEEPNVKIKTQPAEAAGPTEANATEADEQLLAIFEQESSEHLKNLQAGYATLGTQHGKAPSSMVRAAHTLAGIAGTVGKSSLSELASAMEHMLERRNKRQMAGVRLSDSDLTLLQESINAIKQLLSRASPTDKKATADAADADTSALIKRLSALHHPSSEAGETEPVEPVDEDKTHKPKAQAIATVDEVEFDEAMFTLFSEEAQELCSGFNLRLNEWRTDPASKEAPQGLYRLLHTFKGGARMVGAKRLGKMAHELEGLVQHLQNQSVIEPPEIEDVQLDCDSLHEALETLQKSVQDKARPELPDTSVQPAVEMIEDKTHATEAPETVLTDTTQTETPQASTDLTETRAEKSAVDDAADIGEALVPETATEAPPETQQDTSPETPSEPPTLGATTLRVGADMIDRMVADSGEMAIAFTRIQNEVRQVKDSLHELDANVERLRRHLREMEMQAKTQLQAHADQHGVFDPLELDHYSRFQEMVRMMVESVGDVAAVQQGLCRDIEVASSALSKQKRLNRDMQLNLMDTRMLPFASLTDRLQRIVRQAARDTGCSARLIINGSDVKLDRAILERILTPLEHLLRNAVSHGIETVAERRKLGKAAEGRVNLNVSREGNEVLLSLTDDGAGLNLQRLRERAEALGFVRSNAKLDDIQQSELIFLPGVSTSTAVSEVSGRGIGMDIVKNEISNLGGHIEVATVARRGVHFRIHLPLTLSLMEALITRVGNQLFAVPSNLIAQVIQEQIETLNAQLATEHIIWRGKDYPFYFLPRLLGDALAVPELKKRQRALLLESGSHRLAILIDEIVTHQEIVVKNVGPQMAQVLGVDGATVLGDGRVALIINPITLFERAWLSANRDAEDSRQQESAARKHQAAQDKARVLVVDDSLTVRKVTSRLLERSGYTALTARDGVKALSEITQQRPDVVLCDIDMPRMDGFDFLRALQGDPQLRDLPVIMVTSRTAEKHRNLAHELGARHYLGKPYSEEELLRLLAGCINAPAEV